jgi:hypothetical protein
MTSMYFAAVLFKEHAIVLPAVLLCGEYFVVASDDSFAARLRSLRSFYLGLVLTAAIYIALRTVLLHKEFSGFTPFIPFVSLHVGYVDRVLTMFEVVPQWVRLLFWPAMLAAEYGPPAYPIAHGMSWLQLPGILFVVAIFVAGVLLRRRAPVVAFGLSWTVLTLLPASNFILPSGILFAERTLFTPSVGVVIAACGALLHLVGVLRSLCRGSSSSPQSKPCWCSERQRASSRRPCGGTTIRCSETTCGRRLWSIDRTTCSAHGSWRKGNTRRANANT